jgi:hypothetical protein
VRPVCVVWFTAHPDVSWRAPIVKMRSFVACYFHCQLYYQFCMIIKPLSRRIVGYGASDRFPAGVMMPPYIELTRPRRRSVSLSPSRQDKCLSTYSSCRALRLCPTTEHPSNRGIEMPKTNNRKYFQPVLKVVRSEAKHGVK